MIKKIHSALLLCQSLEKTNQFYKKMGFDVEKTADAVRLRFGDFRLTFMDENKFTIKNDASIEPKGTGIYFYFEVENVDSFYQELIEKNIKTSSQPKNWPWGKREFAVKDPDGYKLVFFQILNPDCKKLIFKGVKLWNRPKQVWIYPNKNHQNQSKKMKLKFLKKFKKRGIYPSKNFKKKPI